ncbi:hypothetical protein [Streptomyces aureoversilis]|uniref:Uncharacterized protein n=1 Tax=Streptomyces aureoversilis TaxID=67277 RepID=A0ABW0AA89_9ACTN
MGKHTSDSTQGPLAPRSPPASATNAIGGNQLVSSSSQSQA